MWYKYNYRRHLCDMHIDDWDPAFLSKFSPETYVENLKKAKIKSAMLYFQSHVGLCYYPTASGKMHAGFIGREDSMRRLTELCHRDGIRVTGYYSLIYNTWAHDMYPSWRMRQENGLSVREENSGGGDLDCASGNKAARYGLCCPNNPDYRAFVKTQIEEMAAYFTVDGMFYDMLFWPHMCYCDACKKRWAAEVGGEMPTVADWRDERWLLHMQKRREWIGAFAQWVTALTKEAFGDISVEHNVAYSALPNGQTANCEEVINACDYAGGDLYNGLLGQSFACKFYRSVSKHQPFEYMFSRCAPGLSMHTQIKSKDICRSAVFLTAAHHGATLVIDAIDPVGTMDARVYDRIGEVFEEMIPYEPYFVGAPVEEIGLYYSLKSKFSTPACNYTNYMGCMHTLGNLIENHLPCGITGGWGDLAKHNVLVASCLTGEDAYDNQRLVDYVKNGGCLYFSGCENPVLLKTFFGAEVLGYTEEEVVYIAPKERASIAFEYFNEAYPLLFHGRAPLLTGVDKNAVLATLTLPYTNQHTLRFASIHSNPPGKPTEQPAILVGRYGKGMVLWSGLPIECAELYDYKCIFNNLLTQFFGFSPILTTDASEDVEMTVFREENSLLVSAVQLNTKHTARKVGDFAICLQCDKPPRAVWRLPDEKRMEFKADKNTVTFRVKNFEMFAMYKIEF